MYFGNLIVAKQNISTGAWTNYVYFNGKRVARNDSSGASYYFSDHLNTASVITDSAGNIKAESDYYPWGGELQFVNNDSNHYKFGSKERDNETGLDFFEARYFSSTQGRFTSPDEFAGGPDELYNFADNASDNPTFYADLTNPQSLNKYQYAYNNPLRYTDPNGHCPECAVQAIEQAIEIPAPPQ